MHDDAFHRVENAYHAARELPSAEREAFLAREFADDPEGLAEVKGLFDVTATTPEFIEPPSAGAGLLDALRAPSLVGRRVGAYSILRMIGAGGMGAVYEAEQEQPHRRVAVKVMRTGLGSRQALKRFEYEAEILARLRHPAIAQVYEAGTYDDGAGPVPFFAMELVHDARTLLDHVSDKMLDLPERLELFGQLCEAVQHGHQKGIIHRDLKPANILVDGAGRLKVIDFGVARAADADLTLTSMQTNTGQILGTAQYMSPEQWKADPAEIDTRSDVYALGMLLYELLTDGTAYDLRTAALHEIARVVMEEPPRRPSTLNTVLRGDLETIILKAIEKDRGRRYASASDLARDVTRFLRSEPIEARPASVVYQLRMLARRHRAVATAIAAVFVVLASAAVVSTVFAVRATRAEERETRRAEGEREARQLADRVSVAGRGLASWITNDFINELQSLSGATRAEEALAREVLTYLDRLYELEGANPELVREVAVAYLRVADVLGNPDQHNLGDTAGALTAYRKALALRDRLRARDEAHDGDELARGVLLVRIGQVLALRGDRPAALAHLGRAESTLTPLRGRGVHAGTVEAVLVHAWGLRGALKQETGDFAAAEKDFRRVLATADELQQSRPEAPELARMHALAHFRLGGLAEARGQANRAAEHYRTMIAGVGKAHAEGPPDRHTRRELSMACMKAGDILFEQRDMKGARESYQRALDLRVAEAEANPESARAARDLVVALDNLALVEQALGDATSALERLEVALGIVESRLRSDPGNLDWRQMRWMLCSKAAPHLAARGDSKAAKAMAAMALAEAQALVKLDATSATDRQGVAEAWGDLAVCHVTLINFESSWDGMLAASQAAADCYRQAIAELSRIGEHGEWTDNQKNQDLNFRKGLATMEETIAKIEAAMTSEGK